MPSASDVVHRAFRRLGIVAVDETLNASDFDYGRDMLDAVFAEAQALPWSIVPGFTLTNIPTKAVEPLALAVAAEVASAYGVQAPVPLRTALIRLRAQTAAYVRDLDLDESDYIAPDYGDNVTDDEAEVDKHAAYF